MIKQPGENLQRQLTEIQGQKENLQRQLRETQQREQNSQRQLRDMQQREQNSQRQLTEMQQREDNSQRQLREMLQREENSQRQLSEIQQREENSQRQLAEMQQREENSERQLSEMRQQLANSQRQVSELQLSLSSAQQTISGLRSQGTRDWVIPRDEIQITEKFLGKGGWGSVNEGMYCGCTVAVKQIHELILSPYNIHLFEREMNIASKCRHPHLLQFIGATNDEGSPLFVTELMEKSLRTLLEQRQLSETEIRVISLDVARALNYLHQKKPEPIIHRDVSSANVLLWRQGDQWRGKVSDYGTANFIQQTMTVAPGAMIYSAPEALTSNQTVKVSQAKVNFQDFLLYCTAILTLASANQHPLPYPSQPFLKATFGFFERDVSSRPAASLTSLSRPPQFCARIFLSSTLLSSHLTSFRPSH